MNRRELLKAYLAMSTLSLTGYAAEAATASANISDFEADTPFSNATVRDLARALAAKPFQAPDQNLPDALKSLDYDQYRSIRFLADRSLWRGENRGFEAQFFHRGFFYKDKIEILEVADGRARRLKYRRDDFSFGEGIGKWPDSDLGYAGFRLHAPINKSDYLDEICVFLGASYFRAVAKGEVYGLSARALAIDTGQSNGEEFPIFRAFWLERPLPGVNSIVIHGLLDGKSVAGAYRFTVRPGETTVFDVESTLFPRVDLAHAGVAPLTSMFFFGPNARSGFEDFRPEVHDSDGLAIQNGKGERLWRPLANPKNLQVSAFSDVSPRGFGLLQRERNFPAYQDLESRFERRPSLWVEPIGDWGEGSVALFEIPTKEEVHDNIAAMWSPKQPLAAKSEASFVYRLHWGREAAGQPGLARFTRTGIGAVGDDERLCVLELSGDNLKSLDAKNVKGVVSADKSKIGNIVTQPNPETGGWRLSFHFEVKGIAATELRATLTDGDATISEVWVYRWTA